MNNIKVCHLTSIHSRYDGRIFEKQCSSLSKFGYDVYLIVNDLEKNEVLNGVHIISTSFKPKNRKDRFLHGNEKILEKALSINADIYQFHDPDLMRVGLKLKKAGKIVVYDMHEDVPTDIAYKKWIPSLFRKPVSLIMSLYEKIYLKRYDAILTVTPHVVDRVIKMNKNTFLITNFPILCEEEKNIKATHLGFNICFAGAIVKQWQHIEILNAIKTIDDCNYLLAGPCDEEYMSKIKENKSWEKTKYFGKISHEQVKDLYDNSNIGMALLAYTPTTGNKIGTLGNTKLFEYMQSGLPVICSASEVWKEIINKYKCGICVDPDDISSITKAILYLKDNPEKAKAMGILGKRAIQEEYNWNSQEKKLLRIYNNFFNILEKQK